MRPTERSPAIRSLLVGTTALAASILAGAAHVSADEFRGLGYLGTGDWSRTGGISADGSTVVGRSYDSGLLLVEAFSWTASGGMTGLGYIPGGTSSSANAVNADGSVVVGLANDGSRNRAFRWTAAGGMQSLGSINGGDYGTAKGVSADGAIVVGQATDGLGSAGYNYRAFRWTAATGMQSLGLLPGGWEISDAYGISGDGSTIVGFADSVGGYFAFRWTAATGMQNMGTLTGGTGGSAATAVNHDGSVIVGGSTSPTHVGEAFRWTLSGGMVGLGVAAGGTYSSATAVSADGSVIVGNGDTASAPGGEAVRWTSATGMQSLKQLLVASGVNMTGWTLNEATGVSGDGRLIIGFGFNPSANSEGWLAVCSPICNGLLSNRVMAQSFSGQSAMGQTTNAALGFSLGTFTEVATQAGNAPSGSTPYAAFAYGGYDSDPAASGTLGLTVKLPNEMIAGVTVSANYVLTNMVYDGNSKMHGGSAGVFLARVPDAGLQWLFGVSGITLRGDVTRGYLNGGGLASSTGSTTANGFGAIGRIGWTFDNVLRATQVTPFASYTISRVHFDGYTESGGPFPAQMNGFTDTAQITRFGADVRYALAPGKWIWGTLASAHKLNSSKTDDISGTLIGLFGITAAPGPVAKDWIEATGGVRLPAWKNGAVTASLTASIPVNFPTTYQARVGFSQAF